MGGGGGGGLLLQWMDEEVGVGGCRSRRQLSDVLASEGDGDGDGEDGIEASLGGVQVGVRGCWMLDAGLVEGVGGEDREETLKGLVTSTCTGR